MPTTTPPASTLSTLSPTERNSPPPMPSSRPIYLIVATALSPPMGIGLKGQLPWPALKSDMAFFRRVTSGTGGNAVIMGRKTWESVPVRFRPLGGRVNVVVTRSGGIEDLKEGVLVARSFEESLGVLKGRDSEGSGNGKVFVIGGSQIYRSAMESTETTGLRILQTQVRRKDGKEIECDTFFPLKLGLGRKSESVQGWKRASPDELREWMDGDEKIPGGDGTGEWKVDGGGEMEIRVVGWEKE